MLLLGKPVSRSSISVIFLPSISPGNRRRAIRPAYQLIQDFEMEPYYADAIEKYFNRPRDALFSNITYPIYHRQYKIVSTVSTNRTHWRDCLNNIIVRRKKEILVRFQHLTIENAEDFFYQQILLHIPAWSEQQLKGNYPDYRSRFQAEFSNKFQILIKEIQKCIHYNILKIIPI